MALPTTDSSPQYDPFLTSNPGGVGKSYGQASSDLITEAQKTNPDLATALQKGTAQLNSDDSGSFLVDTKTGQRIGGNYLVTSTPDGQTAINIPTPSGAMVQVVAGTASDGTGALSPVSSNNVFNVGLNRSTGGFGGGVTDFMSAAAPAISVIFPAAAPYIMAYNSASAANKGKYGVAILDALGAAGVYGAQNPDTQVGQIVKQVTDTIKNNLPIGDTTGTTGTTGTGSPTTTEPTTSGNLPTTDKLGNYNITSSTSVPAGGDPSLNPSKFSNEGFNLNTAGASPNLPDMNGGRGLTVPTGSNLGDPSSFINNPAITGVPPAGTISAKGVTPQGTLPSLGDPNSIVNTGALPAAAALTAAQVAAAAKAVASLAGGSPSSSVPSAGTSGSSSGPWNAPMANGAVVLGASKPTAFADPLTGLMNNITPTYAPSNSSVNDLMAKEYQAQFGASGYAKGGKVEEHLNKLEPEYLAIIKERLKSDKSHPNYGGLPLFRTGGLGKHVQGPGTGQSDDIPAMLADGEYVFDADTVSALGDGSNKAGAEALDKMREKIRHHKRSAPIDKIPPKAKNPLEYLKGKHS
jgi:hypothetical protein